MRLWGGIFVAWCFCAAKSGSIRKPLMRILTVADPPPPPPATRLAVVHQKLWQDRWYEGPTIISYQHQHRLAADSWAYSREIFSHLFLKYSLTFFSNCQKTSGYALSRLKLLFLFNVKMCRKFRIKFASYSNQFQNSLAIIICTLGKAGINFSFFVQWGETQSNCHCSRKTKV